MGGGLELKSATVARYAPWGYDFFLRLVGEDPDSLAKWAELKESKTKHQKSTGFDFKALPLGIETNQPQVVVEDELDLVSTNTPDDVLTEEVQPASTNDEEQVGEEIPVG